VGGLPLDYHWGFNTPTLPQMLARFHANAYNRPNQLDILGENSSSTMPQKREEAKILTANRGLGADMKRRPRNPGVLEKPLLTRNKDISPLGNNTGWSKTVQSVPKAGI
jgi:hypothetical protein